MAKCNIWQIWNCMLRCMHACLLRSNTLVFWRDLGLILVGIYWSTVWLLVGIKVIISLRPNSYLFLRSLLSSVLLNIWNYGSCLELSPVLVGTSVYSRPGLRWPSPFVESILLSPCLLVSTPLRLACLVGWTHLFALCSGQACFYLSSGPLQRYKLFSQVLFSFYFPLGFD